MNLRPIHLFLAGCVLATGLCAAQDKDSPRVGNSERGRILLSVLGPKPHDAAGISPLQQQELNRRVRCAATRQEIQDQLDFEAAGSPGFYPLMQLREMEKEACTPIPQFGLPASPQPAATSFHPPAQRAGATAAQPRSVQPAAAPASAPAPASIPAPRPVPVAHAPAPAALPAPTLPVAAPASAPPSTTLAARTTPAAAPTGPSYTPAPDYPADEMAAGHEGSVLVQLIMNADGSVQAASVAKSSGFAALDASALQAARAWRIPAAAGRTINVPLTFSSH